MPLHAITEELVRDIVAEYTDLRSLNLANNRIRVLENLEPLHRLRRLDVSDNLLSELDNVRCLTNLTALHLRGNRITAVRDLGPLNELAEVDLSRNALADFAFLEALAALPALRRLDLSANPVASMPEYRETVLRLLPKLEMLDGRAVSVAERKYLRLKDADEASLTAGRAAVPPPSLTIGPGGRPALPLAVASVGAAEERGLESSHRQLQAQLGALREILDEYERSLGGAATPRDEDGGGEGHRGAMAEAYHSLLQRWRMKVFELLVERRIEAYRVRDAKSTATATATAYVRQIARLQAALQDERSRTSQLATRASAASSTRAALSKLATECSKQHDRYGGFVRQTHARVAHCEARLREACDRLHLLQGLMQRRARAWLRARAALAEEKALWRRQLQDAALGGGLFGSAVDADVEDDEEDVDAAPRVPGAAAEGGSAALPPRAREASARPEVPPAALVLAAVQQRTDDAVSYASDVLDARDAEAAAGTLGLRGLDVAAAASIKAELASLELLDLRTLKAQLAAAVLDRRHLSQRLEADAIAAANAMTSLRQQCDVELAAVRRKARASVSEALRRASDAEERLAARESELAAARREVEATRKDLSRAEAAAAAAAAASDAAVTEAETAAGSARADAARAHAQVRALERELARVTLLREEEGSSARVASLEARLRDKDAELALLRRERNSLLAAVNDQRVRTVVRPARAASGGRDEAGESSVTDATAPPKADAEPVSDRTDDTDGSDGEDVADSELLLQRLHSLADLAGDVAEGEEGDDVAGDRVVGAGTTSAAPAGAATEAPGPSEAAP